MTDTVEIWNGKVGVFRNPTEALQAAQKLNWVVDGVIPSKSIVWLVGPPAEGKTFGAMDLAAHVSSGRSWMGRPCTKSAVIYLAAEGGQDIHVRRAAAELAAGESGDLYVVQARPMIAEPEGVSELAGIIDRLTLFTTFERVREALGEVENYHKYLTADELEDLKARERFYELGYRKHEEGKQLSRLDQEMLTSLEQKFYPHKWSFPAEDWGQRLARDRLPKVKKAALKFDGKIIAGDSDIQFHASILVVVDTYSATAADDSKAVVAAYIKNLRDLIEEAERDGVALSFIVIDHMTKSGDSFMGSQAKLGDSDAMIEVERHGQLVTLTCPEKMRAAKPFSPIHLELAPFELKDFPDSQGRPLSTLVVRDGEKAHRAQEAAGSRGETSAAVILELLDDGELTVAELQEQFRAYLVLQGRDLKPDSIRRNFSRAFTSLEEDGLVQTVGEMVIRV